MLTHGDLKHVGGAEELAAEFRCHDIFASSFRFRSVAYRRIFTALQRDPYHITAIHRGDETAPWRILHPTKEDESSQADDGALVAAHVSERAQAFHVAGRTPRQPLLF
jgi:beta-lactamase superfamily II metal-dependent hydrolase